MLKSCIAAFTILVAWTANAQEYAFKVLANKGNNEVKAEKADNWQPLRAGTILHSSDQLKVVDNAYLGLVHSSGKPMEWKKSGSFKVGDLAAQVKGGSDVVSKYTDFIISSNSAESKKNRLSATGSVSRDVNTSIQVMLPENRFSNVFGSKVIVSWENSTVQGPYVVKLKNLYDDELVSFETTEKKYTIDLDNPKIAKESNIQVEVNSKTEPSSDPKSHLLKRLPAAEQTAIKTEYAAIQSALQEPTAVNKILLAQFYEEKKLLIDALTAYQEAISLEPEVPEYQETFQAFLSKYNIEK